MGFEFGKPKGRKPASFIAAANAAPDPLMDVEYPGDLAGDCKVELDAVQAAFRARRKGEDKRFRQATDSEYWVALCFKDRDAKETFLRESGLLTLGDKYLDGHKAAAVLKIEGV